MTNKDKGSEAIAVRPTKPTALFRFQDMDDAFSIADIVAKSTLCPKDYRGRPGDIIVAWQLGAEVGLEPMQALAGIAVINGRASLWGDTFLAVAMNHPAFVGIQEMSFSEIKIKQEATCIVVRKNREPVHRTFSVRDAQQAQLWGKQGPWKQYPERMLQMRARGFAIRDVFPDALIGMISAEEAHDYQVSESQHDGPMELTDGTHKFGFASKPKQEPALEPASDSPVYVQLIESILAARDEESLAACRPNGDLLKDERELANRAWASRRDKIREEKKAKAKPAATPKPVGPAAASMEAPIFIAPPPEEPEEESNPWEKHLAQESDTEAAQSEEEPYDAARDAEETMK